MPLHFSFFEVLVLIGITQGFFMAGAIWGKKNSSTSKLLLAGVLIVFNFLCFKILIHTTGLWQTAEFRYFPLAFELAIQPFTWLYISALTKPGFKLKPIFIVHFLPFAVSLIYSVFVYLAVLPQPELAVKDAIANNLYFNQIKQFEDYLSVISGIIYWFLGLQLILKYRQWLYANISDTDFPTYAWLRNIAFSVGILILGLAAAIILDSFFHFGNRFFIHWELFFVYLASLIYYLGFKGYQLPDKQPVSNLKFVEAKDSPVEKEFEPPTTSKTFPEIHAENSISPEIKITKERNFQVKALILKVLEVDEIYLNPELNLAELAKAINTSPTLVSAVINQNFQKSFRNLVNEYRIEKVKQRLHDPKLKQLSIAGIAYECGFNSEASFYRIFKNAVGVSPKEYLNQLPT